MQLGLSEYVSKELRFQLKEFRLDMVASVKECESLLNISFNYISLSETTQFLLKVKYTFENIITRLEHVITSHLSQCLKIVGQVLNSSLILKSSESLASFENHWDYNLSENLNNVPLKIFTKFYINLKHIHLNLTSVIYKVDQLLSELVNNFKFQDILWENLVKTTEEIVGQIQPRVTETYLQSVRLYYVLEPEAAKQDEHWKLLTTPLREEIYIQARSLDICPNCGSSLISDDRTFDGSYCEDCRTRWIQPT